MILPALTPDTALWVADRVGLPAGLAPYVVPAAAVALGFVGGLVLEVLLARVLHRFAAKSETKLDDLLVGALRGPVRLFATILGVGAAILLSRVPDVVRSSTERLLLVVVLLAIIVVAARLLGGLIRAYGHRARLVGSTQSLVARLTRIGIYVVGGLFILDNQGVAITPLLTTLGLAGLAVALALQDTLSNFFSGIHVQADKPLDVGHYVRFEDLNIEGYVVEVGWRTTKVRTLPNNIVVIPNARVASSIVTDYHLPEPRMSLLVPVPVTREADPRRVEEVLIGVAKKAAEDLPGILREPAPFVRFIPGFTDHGYQFTLICQVKEFVDQYAAQHELRYRIMEAFEKEGFALPYPIRVLRSDEGDGSVPVTVKEKAKRAP